MYTAIIATVNESETLNLNLRAFLNQFKVIDQDFEILVVGPDQATREIVEELQKTNPQVKYIKDQHQGKPAALNMAIRQARGKILILSDGDVKIQPSAINYLIKPFKDSNIGASTGQPVSIDNKNKLFGYWSYFLVHAAHQMRLKKKKFPCSGYLYAFRKKLITKIPENSLSEDAWVSQEIRKQGQKIVYTPNAKVQVKYPNNLRDWLKQKIRSAGGYLQLKEGRDRDLLKEAIGGIKIFFTYPENLKEYFWTILLYFTRIMLWFLIFWKIKIKRRNFHQIWQRVESAR